MEMMAAAQESTVVVMVGERMVGATACAAAVAAEQTAVAVPVATMVG